MPLESTEPYLVIQNDRTGRIEIYRNVDNVERIVASMPVSSTPQAIHIFLAELRRDDK